MNIFDYSAANRNKLAIQWVGNDGWILTNGEKFIATDLDLFNLERIESPLVDTSLLASKLDILFITHEHEDHFNKETVELLKTKSNCKFVIPKSCEDKALSINVPKNRLVFVEPNDKLDFGYLKVKCIRAVHGHISGTIYSGANMKDCGYLFDFCKKKIYQPGDTVLLQEHTEMEKVDILFVSPTEHNTQIENSLKLISWLKPGMIFLQHHSTYLESDENLFWSHGYILELKAAMDRETAEKTIIPTQNECYSF